MNTCQMSAVLGRLSGHLCGKIAQWSFPAESGGRMYMCEDCRVTVGADPQHLTREDGTSPTTGTKE